MRVFLAWHSETAGIKLLFLPDAARIKKCRPFSAFAKRSDHTIDGMPAIRVVGEQLDLGYRFAACSMGADCTQKDAMEFPGNSP
jgi:hypothetical protein